MRIQCSDINETIVVQDRDPDRDETLQERDGKLINFLTYFVKGSIFNMS